MRTSAPALSNEQIEAGLTRRSNAKKQLEEAASRQQARDQARLRAKKADEKHAAGGHTPSGWVPANQRNDYIDPLAKDQTPDVELAGILGVGNHLIVVDGKLGVGCLDLRWSGFALKSHLAGGRV